MSTKYIAILAGAVILIGAGYYFMSGASVSDVSQEQGDASGTSLTMDEAEFSGSFMDLAQRGGNYKCTFVHEDANAASSGTVYVSGAKIRADSTSSTQGMTIENHMISDGEYVYVWSPSLPQGFKVPASQGEGSGDPGMSGQYGDFNQQYAYDCDTWSGDASMFAPPSDVTFMSTPSY